MVVAPTAFAQSDFPNRPVTIVVPYAPGGATDNHARTIANKLSEIWKQPVVIDNKAGGGSIIGTQQVARAAPDGYTILMASYSYTSNPILKKSMPYADDALSPLAMIGTNSLLLYVSNASGIKTTVDLTNRIRSGAGALKLASSGNGSSPHIGLELLGKTAGGKIMHVPYKGAVPAMNDVFSGTVDGLFDGVASLPHARSERVRAIAIAGAERHPVAPEIPTFKELGLDLQVNIWYGLMIPTGTPKSLQAKINSDINRAIREPEVFNKLSQAGVMVGTGDQAMFSNYLSLEAARLKSLVEGGVRFEVD